MEGREKGGMRLGEGEETEGVASPGQWQERWVCGIEKCPVDGRAGRRSEYFVLRGASRSRAGEDRQHPWWESGGKIRALSAQANPKPLRQCKASHAPDGKQQFLSPKIHNSRWY
jgi:hypothetical protein